MFEEYLEDASYFLDKARKANEEKAAKRYYRVSVFCAASAMEAFINYEADTLSKGAPLQPHEIAFISDKKFVFELNKQNLLVERNEFHPLEDKLGLLIKKFISGFDFKSNPDWKIITQFKEFRNTLVHPRESEDKTSLKQYDETLKSSISSIIVIMDMLYQSMHHSRLRPKLLDLMPD